MPQHQPDLETLLEYLKRTRGFDFTGYKRASLQRRIDRRLQTVGVATIADYLDYLEVHPEEFGGLFNTILINVTGFFRDASTWEFVAQTVVPELLSRRESAFPIRVWSAGCASGEEAYTLAMIFAEAMGSEAFRERVKIYATDVDEEALAKARQALYTEREVEAVPPALLEKYFEANDSRYTFRKDLRRQVIFGRHDLIQDAPISHVDMLVCRNTLMYFNAETQAKIIARFHFAMNDGGVLMLGRAETLMTHTSVFTPLDVKRRISLKVSQQPISLRERLFAIAREPSERQMADGHLDGQGRLLEAAIDMVPVAEIVVNPEGLLVMANERARSQFGIATSDLHRPLQDSRISYRPIELRAAIDRAYAERRPAVIRDIEWPGLSGEMRWLDVHVFPLLDSTDGSILGAGVAFHDVTAPKRLQRDLEHANQELETAYEELQSTNEELETTNEELQSTVEELETTNEELQSTNEELETMNEELQSTNEELSTMNDELRTRGEALNEVNGLLESILTSLRGAVVVIDPELNIVVWNQGAEELWGLREDEVRGNNILGLDIGMPTEQLKRPVRACLSGSKSQVTFSLDAVNRRGRAIVCHVTTTPLVTRAGTIRGVIIVMTEQPQANGADGAGSARDHAAAQRKPAR